LRVGLPPSAAAYPGEAPQSEHGWEPVEETVADATFKISDAARLTSVVESDVEFISTIAETLYDKSRIIHFLFVFTLAAVVQKKQIQIIKKICITG
jgi:hypothetical protein